MVTSLPPLNYFNISVLWNNANAESAKWDRIKSQSAHFLLSFLFSPFLSSPVQLLRGWFLVFSFNTFPDIPVLAGAYIGVSLTQNTKGSLHTHSHVTCFIHLITYLGHLSMSVKIKSFSVVPASLSHWSASSPIACSSRSIPHSLVLLWPCACHFLCLECLCFSGTQ